jgi:hypothetical protein
MSIGKLLKDLAPIAISAFAGPQVGAGIGKLFGAESALSPFLSRAITGAATSKLMGGKNKDAVRNALLAGIGGAFFDDAPAQTTMQDGTNVRTTPTGEKLPFAMTRSEQTVSGGASPISDKPPVESAVDRIKGTPKTFTGELLQAGGISDENLLARLLNTRVGEGLTAGLIAQLLAGDDDEERPREFEQRPFGFGGPGGRLGGVTFAQDGGPMAFPRRNGGIDPSEGSGTKDDVPAMLMAGEFVLTKDAVKGLGDGNQRKGIQRAYDMMDKLEARA